MLGVAIAAIVVVACSAAIGQGLCALAGRREWAWWAPGAGLAAMLAIGGVLVRVPGHSKSAAMGIALATIGSLLLPSVRRALGSALPEAWPIVLLALALSLIPFLVWGRTGVLGVGVNNDSGAHMGTVWWLQHARGPAPVGALGGPLVYVGYPLGPHGVMAALSLSVGWISVEHAFDGFAIAIAPLTALVAMAALPQTRRAWRLIAALLVGMSYLTLSFQVQAAFKETMEALLVLTVVAATRDLLANFEPGWRWRWRAAIPVTVAIAGSIYIYSYGGVIWPLGAVAAVVLVSGRLRAAIEAVPGFVLTLGVLVLPQIGQMARFSDSPFHGENGEGNLLHAISPFEMLGVWFDYDFRWTPTPLWPTAIGVALVCLAATIAVVRLVRRSDLVLLAASIPILAVYAYSAAAKGIYLSAKAGAIAAPLLALAIASGLLAGWQGRPGRIKRVGLGSLAALTAALAAWSSFLVLRDARVGPTDHRTELHRLVSHIDTSQPILFMPKSDMAQWDLIGLPVAQLRDFYAPWVVPRTDAKPGASIGFFDFDVVSAQLLNQFRYVITTNSPYQSTPPPGWHRLAHTRSFILWVRRGRTHTFWSTDYALSIGRVLDCSTPYGQLRLGGAAGGYGVVLPRPITARPTRWSSQPWLSGDSATMTVRVPRGTWDLSLNYASYPGLIVQAGSLRRRMPATIDRNGPYYLVGKIHQRRTGLLRIRVTQQKIGWFGRAIGSGARTRALDSPSNWPLGGVALTPHPLRPRRLPTPRFCGHFVDHVLPHVAPRH